MSVNRVTLIGNLGKDPEIRYTPSGDAVANFTLATTEKFKGRDGQLQEVTTWHNIIVWRQLAEICGKFLHKGKQVYLEGKIQTRSYDDRDGVKKYITEIVCDNMQMLSGPKDGDRPAKEPQESDYKQPTEPPFNADDDTIPFSHGSAV